MDSTDNVTGATVINGGTGYTTAPSCAIAGPTNANPYLSPTNTTLFAGGTQATCTAAVTAGSQTAVWTVKISERRRSGSTDRIDEQLWSSHLRTLHTGWSEHDGHRDRPYDIARWLLGGYGVPQQRHRHHYLKD